MDQGQGQQQQQPTVEGTKQALGVVLPLATLAAGIYRPSAVPAFATLVQGGHYADQQARALAKAEQEAAGRAATAGNIRDFFGLPVDPNQDPQTQLALLGTQEARTKFRAEQEKERASQAEAQRGRESYATLARNRLAFDPRGSTDALEASLRNLDPSVIRDPQTLKELQDQQAMFASQAKKLAEVNAAVRPFQRQGEGALGESTYDLTVTPSNVEQFRQHLLETGIDPKAAETYAMQFNLPVEKLPGGLAAQREAVKPPYVKTDIATSPEGRVSTIVTRGEPQTGLPVTDYTQLPAEIQGQRQAPPSYNQAEILNSLGAVIAGQPPTLPMHAGLTPQTASQIVDTIRRAQAAEATPGLAAGIISLQQQASQDRLKALDRIVRDTNQPLTARMRAETEQVQERAKLAEYDRLLNAVVGSGLRSIAPPPSGAPGPAPLGGNPAAARDALGKSGWFR